MFCLWDRIYEMFTNLVKPTRRKTRVTFSPSTLHRELQRNTKLLATQNPFFNFLAELRLKIQNNEAEYHNRSLGQRDMVKITKTAGLLWKSMSEEAKQPYRNMAMEYKKLKRLKGRRRRRTLWTRKKGRRYKRRKSLTEITIPIPEIIGDSLLNNNNNNQLLGIQN
ncbi:uncharacterized protein ACRADG_010189 [Cochliomyia hominivorax]